MIVADEYDCWGVVGAENMGSITLGDGCDERIQIVSVGVDGSAIPPKQPPSFPDTPVLSNLCSLS